MIYFEGKENWVIWGARLKRLREGHQMSRAVLARMMNTSETRLARLENGKPVRDAHTLSKFYEQTVNNQILVEELEETRILLKEIMGKISSMELYVEKTINQTQSTADISNLIPTKSIHKSGKSKKTRLQQRNII